MNHKFVWIAAAAIALAGVLWIMLGRRTEIHSQNSPNKLVSAEEQGVRDLVEHLQPTAVTEAELGNVRVEVGTLDSKGIRGIRYGFATGILPLFEASKGVNVSEARVRVVKDGKNIRCHHWIRGARYSIECDWGNSAAKRTQLSDRDQLAGTGLTLKDSNAGEENSVMIIFGQNPVNRSEEVIAMTIFVNGAPKQPSTILPYKHAGYRLLAPFSVSDYPIAVSAKVLSAKNELATIMLFDVANGTVLGEAPIPAAARNDRPCFAIDTEKNVLVAMSYYLDWCFYVDLSPHVKE